MAVWQSPNINMVLESNFDHGTNKIRGCVMVRFGFISKVKNSGGNFSIPWKFNMGTQKMSSGSGFLLLDLGFCQCSMSRSMFSLSGDPSKRLTKLHWDIDNYIWICWWEGQKKMIGFSFLILLSPYLFPNMSQYFPYFFFIEPHEFSHKKNMVFPPEIHGIHAAGESLQQTLPRFDRITLAGHCYVE